MFFSTKYKRNKKNVSYLVLYIINIQATNMIFSVIYFPTIDEVFVQSTISVPPEGQTVTLDFKVTDHCGAEATGSLKIQIDYVGDPVTTPTTTKAKTSKTTKTTKAKDTKTSPQVKTTIPDKTAKEVKTTTTTKATKTTQTSQKSVTTVATDTNTVTDKTSTTVKPDLTTVQVRYDVESSINHYTAE